VVVQWYVRCRLWLISLRLGVTDAECNASLLDNPLFNGCLLRDLAKLWAFCTANASLSRSSPANNRTARTATTGCTRSTAAANTLPSASIAASASKRHGWKACQSVTEARESTVQALQQLGLISVDRATSGGHGNSKQLSRAEQDEAIVTSVLQVTHLILVPYKSVSLFPRQWSWGLWCHDSHQFLSGLAQGCNHCRCASCCVLIRAERVVRCGNLRQQCCTKECGKPPSCFYRGAQVPSGES
jgi:hypothetical protein